VGWTGGILGGGAMNNAGGAELKFVCFVCVRWAQGSFVLSRVGEGCRFYLSVLRSYDFVTAVVHRKKYWSMLVCF
jgi:hypothetical protein